MRVQFTIVGTVERHDNVWAELDAVPREGDYVELPGVPPTDTIVRTVVWYPLGDAEGRTEGSFVYVVLGPRRPF